jgi:RHS repeat-associated protein
VQEKDVDGNVLPALKFRYGFNPRYRERCAFAERNELVDFYFGPDAGLTSEFPYYLNYYRESWGYYRSDCDHKPGDDQRAWSLREILYPGGAKETLEWESNKYRWTVAGGEGYFYDDLKYMPDSGSLGPDGAERGGIRVKSRRLDGGLGTDSAFVYNYGEGVATRTQTSCKKALYTGFLGNSQEVGYRSSEVQLEGESQNQTTQTYFTNGSAPDSIQYCFVDYHGQIPEPPVSSSESFRDLLETCFAGTSHVLLNGIARGLPYKQVVRDNGGDLLVEKDISYEFDTRAAFNVDMSHDTMWFGNMPGIKARSTWVKRASENKWVYDENGLNPVEYITTYDYDTVNGLVIEQNDLLGNGLESRVVTEYLHTQDGSLKDLLAQKNILNLVRMQEVHEVYNGAPETASRTTYEYSDFGNGRVYLWRQNDYATIISKGSGPPDRILTTSFLAYDQYGNPTLVKDPSGTMTTYRYGYAGAKLILEAPNADTGEVSYNGMEDGLTFDGWNVHDSQLSSELAYSGDYCAKVVVGKHLYGPNKVIDDALLTPGRYYVFSGWVYTTGNAHLWVGLLGIPGGPEFGGHSTTTGIWERVEVVFQYPEEATGLECYTSESDGTAYFDDLRIHPHDSPMQTNAYDRATGQLQAMFDANNVAAERYFYDGFGRLSAIRNPADTVIAQYVYYHSRSDSDDFDPENPNHVLEFRFRAPTSDYCVTKTFYDGLNREIQKLEQTDMNYANVSGTFHNSEGLVAAKTEPVELCSELYETIYGTAVDTLVPADWQVGQDLISGSLHDYYDASGPGPDCHGYPYTEYDYSDDPLRRLKETGFPDTTWKAGSERTSRMAYLSNNAGDVEGWGANELTKTQAIDEGGLVGYEYVDRLGRVVQTHIDSIDADGSRVKTMFDYDILCNLTRSVRQRSEAETDTTIREYNALSQLVRDLSPDGGATSYLYDRNGNLRFVMDSVRASENEFVYYKYDSLNRLIEEGIITGTLFFDQANADDLSFPDSALEIKFSYSYDSLGVNYSRGRLSSWVDGSGKYGRSLSYDDVGRVVSEEDKVDDSVVTFSYTYDMQGNLKTHSTGTNGVFPIIHYLYDWANRLVGVGHANDPDGYAHIHYWPDNSIRQLRLRDNVSGGTAQAVDYTYNPRGWLISINDTSDVVGDLPGNTDHFSEHIGYLYSTNGDIDTIVTKHSGEDAFTETFKYDRLRRLMQWHDESSPDTATDEIFHYDRAGNFTFWKPSNSDFGYDCTYFPGTNRLESIQCPDNHPDYYSAYDLNGNLTAESHRLCAGWDMPPYHRYFEHDYRNIASKITVPHSEIPPYSAYNDYVSYVYDADLQRVKKLHEKARVCVCPDDMPNKDAGPGTDPGPGPGLKRDYCCYDSTTTLYFFTHDGRLVREMVDGEVKRDYLFAGGGPIGVAERIDTTDRFSLQYFIKDHLGSTRQVVDSTGQVVSQFDYYPYGALRRSFGSLDTKLRFTGKQFDDEEVQQYYYGARYLNGNNLRFNSVDPAAGKYPGWSPYVYALGNPVRFVDPGGGNPVAFFALLGQAALDVLDVYAFTVSLDEYRRDPSVGTGLVAAGDAAGLAPIAFGYGRIREILRLGNRAWNWVTGAKTAEAATGVSRTAESAVKITDNAVETAETARRSFSSFEELKRVLGPAGEGKEWHHIVEQSQVSRFGAELIHNTENVVAIPKGVHRKINAVYQSKPKFAEGKIVREWLKSQSFEEQRKFGMETLNELIER